MKATIVNYRRSRHNQKTNQLILSVSKIKDKENAESLIGKEVVFTTQNSKEIKGKISASHGNKGCIRAIFEQGIPGQALGQTVEVKNGNA